jgi:hypothetical protein
MEVGEFMRRFVVIGSAVAVLAAAFVVAVGGIGASASTSYDSPAMITATGASILNWTGQGGGANFTSDCSAANDPGGLNAPYLLWIFTTDGGSVTGTPVLTVNSDVYSSPKNVGGAYQFVTSFYPTTTPPTTASVAFDVSTTGSGDWVLTLSHGCPPVAPPTPTTITTVVFDATAEAAWAGTEVAPASAYDTSIVTAGTTGTVSYNFFSNSTCEGDGADAGTVAVGTQSSTEATLAPGSYSFRASYNGDASHAGSTSPCEPFSVTAPPPGPTETSITTVVFDAVTKAALIGGNLAAGGSVYDTSTVTTGATGTVSYEFWANGDCGVSEHVAGTDAGTALALGSHSNTEGPLTAGSYSFEADYTSDNTGLFTNATGSCEPFTVVAGGVGGSTASPSPTAAPTGAVLAATGGDIPAQGLALFLITFGLLAMVGGVLAWRRRRF